MLKLLARCPAWMLLPIYQRDYRQLLLRSYVLGIRARTLECAVAIAFPFATVGLIAMLRRHSDALSADIAVFKQRVREWRRTGRAVARFDAPPNPWA